MASAVVGLADSVSGPRDAERVPGPNLQEAIPPPTAVRIPGSDRTAPATPPTPPGWRSSCPTRERAEMAATLAHELAHAVTHDAAASLPRDVREVIAESAAYIVRERFGLDRSLRSTHDVASWLDDPDAFKFGMAAVHDAASSLIDAIESAERGMKDQAHRSAVIIAAAPGEEPPPVPARVASAEAGRR